MLLVCIEFLGVSALRKLWVNERTKGIVIPFVLVYLAQVSILVPASVLRHL